MDGVDDVLDPRIRKTRKNREVEEISEGHNKWINTMLEEFRL